MRKLIILLFFIITCSAGFAQSYTVHTLAGDTAGYYNGTNSGGYRNGVNDTALFNAPVGVAADTLNNVFVTDFYNNQVRKIAGLSTIQFVGDTAGFRDGSGSSALFNGPIGICIDSALNLYIADTYNHAIRKVTPGGVVTTIAGKGPDSAGYRNGPIANALFNTPIGVAIDRKGNLYVTDNGNNVIRKISLITDSVTTLAGNDTLGYRNGADTSAEFFGLAGITTDKYANVYVTEIDNNTVREISNGFVSTIGGVDTIGYDTLIYTTAPGYQNGGADTSMFNNPTGVVVDDSGKVYVCDEYNNVIRMIWKGTVTTFAGTHTPGFINGNIDSAEFYQPTGIAMDNHGDFFIADNGNNVVREIYPPGVTGIKPVPEEKTKMLVFPNPCNDLLNIVSSKNGEAELLDLTGRTIWSTEHFVSPYSLPTNTISPGVYFFRLNTAGQSAISKIVVSH